MNKRILSILILTMCLITSGFALAQKSDKQTDKDNLSNVALKLVANHNNLSIDDLEIVNSIKAEYPLQGKIVFHYKIADKNRLYGIALDENGKEIDSEKLFVDEQNVYIARYGKLEPALVELLKNSSVEKPINIIIWMKEKKDRIDEGRIDIIDNSINNSINNPINYSDLKDNNSLEKNSLEKSQEIEEFYKNIDKRREIDVENIITPLADKLKKNGYRVITDNSAPVIFTSLASKEIRELAQLDSIDTIYLDKTNEQNLDTAVPTILSDGFPRSIGGYGVKIGIIDKGGRIVKNNPYLGLPSAIVQNNTYVCNSPSLHTTGLAGIFRSWDQRYFGITPGAWLWIGGSCNGISSELMSRSTAAKDWGAKVLSLSWGHDSNRVPDSTDRFYDNLVLNNRRTVVVAAGNRGCGSNGNVESPGLAYNVITTGNFDDRNNRYWDDIMNPCSSWRNPISYNNDREKPEVASPGTNIESTTISSPWVGNIGSGTSLSASFVAGEAAMLIQRNNRLTTWPEAIKAIIMASATNNIEGNTRLSEYDGVGGIGALKADNIAEYELSIMCFSDPWRCYTSRSWGGQAYSCSNSTPQTLTYMLLHKDIRTRAVITWDNDPSYSGYNSRPGADLDLRIINTETGAQIVSSGSYNNNFEIVDFIPNLDGVYSLQVTKYRCDKSPRYIGYAWSEFPGWIIVQNDVR